MSDRKNILVCFAMKEEAEEFRKLVTGRPGVSSLVTGIGRKNADREMRRALSANKPDGVYTCGFAGGLDPGLKVGEVVFATDDPGLGEKLTTMGCQRVKIFCADRIATTVAEKQALRQSTGAEAVEMESEAIHAVCREQGIPCATLRVISDTANEDLPLDFNKLAKADMSVDYGKLAMAVLRNPGKVPALKRLQANTELAARRLAEVLAKVV